jgi:hypothetical protein
MFRYKLQTLLLMGCIVGMPRFAHAQAASGTDMWTGEQERYGLYTPHGNNCNTTNEVFVAMGQTSGSKGFCMDKDLTTPADTWENARQTCAAAAPGKRLPEPAEFKYACNNPPTGLVHMSDTWQWATNYPTTQYNSTSNQVLALTMGNGGCDYSTSDTVSDATGHQATWKFRCVH